MRTLTLKLPPDLSDWLEKQARALNRPKSEIARSALLAHRHREDADSVVARAGELVGKYAGGKHSSHKRNLKGLGSCKHS